MLLTKNTMKTVVASVAETFSEGITLQVPDGKGGFYFHSCQPHNFQRLKRGDSFLVGQAAENMNQFQSTFTVAMYPCTTEGDIVTGKMTEEETAAAEPLTVCEKTFSGIRVLYLDPWKRKQLSGILTPTNWECVNVGEVLNGFQGANCEIHLYPIR